MSDIDLICELLADAKVFTETETGLKRYICAKCPNDGFEAQVSRVEKNDTTVLSVEKAAFYCPICNSEFVASAKDMYFG
ncbi:hypothetical protein ASJ33_05055 [Dehalococcoides mccartyi]|jgi:hypothetical protein|uniref:Uncharacterized protein n=1 Tax=Dehalococcoides mccartyi (strain VS) TaxID=311424 RepID=D2BI57_DEHMV|nr:MULTISPECIES: hypothetical protein [Dehalococcoides]ACZ62007.1 hypothetical protein DhcVS_883 [Dehalococcoides mccartyi VS]AII58052.1 hypothetical protein X792_04625 [Dehalococcoides mccartyi CG1]APH12562.1 hypothetical protein ASJ33_05055 [Dehalococcoides mccartyi]QYY57924.1 hypothetical protein CWV2_001217 [Dehalococcoides mccartyi]BAQ34805.1 hypothetical protein UCH007_08470 [Dehalococcoides sp. UCH007]